MGSEKASVAVCFSRLRIFCMTLQGGRGSETFWVDLCDVMVNETGLWRAFRRLGFVIGGQYVSNILKGEI